MAANDLSEIDFTCASIIKNQDGCVCRYREGQPNFVIS